MLRKLIISAIIIAITATCYWRMLFAQDDSERTPKMIFENACRLYSESKFNEAIKEYEKVLDYGRVSPALYYNLGNSYFKEGFLGKAILNYERAKRLDPYDSDLMSNLEYAYSLVQEPAMDRSRIWLVRKMRNFLDSFTLDGLTALLSAIYTSAILLLILSLFKENLRRTVFGIVTVLALTFLAGLSLLSINICRTKYAQSSVILSKEVNARFEPFENATVYFKLSEGCRIQVLKTRDNWSQIKREDGKVGWVESSAYEII